jgi:hypothetical protein
MKAFLPIFLVIALASPARGQAPSGENPATATRTMAALMADGYEQQTVQIFKDKIWMRRADGEGLPYICDRGRIGTPAFDAYRDKRYEQISCSIPK